MIEPIVEYIALNWRQSDREKSWFILDEREGSKYEKGVIEALRNSHGLYLFYDSRGKALYAGKAVKQSLWNESNLAVNRDRQDLQQIRIVTHPQTNVEYRPYNQKIRQPSSVSLKLHEIACYYSAYSISDKSTIPAFEALVIRAFANDLLNKKMEKFPLSG